MTLARKARPTDGIQRGVGQQTQYIRKFNSEADFFVGGAPSKDLREKMQKFSYSVFDDFAKGSYEQHIITGLRQQWKNMETLIKMFNGACSNVQSAITSWETGNKPGRLRLPPVQTFANFQLEEAQPLNTSCEEAKNLFDESSPKALKNHFLKMKEALFEVKLSQADLLMKTFEFSHRWWQRLDKKNSHYFTKQEANKLLTKDEDIRKILLNVSEETQIDLPKNVKITKTFTPAGLNMGLRMFTSIHWYDVAQMWKVRAGELEKQTRTGQDDAPNMQPPNNEIALLKQQLAAAQAAPAPKAPESHRLRNALIAFGVVTLLVLTTWKGQKMMDYVKSLRTSARA